MDPFDHSQKLLNKFVSYANEKILKMTSAETRLNRLCFDSDLSEDKILYTANKVAFQQTRNAQLQFVLKSLVTGQLTINNSL